MHKTLKVNIYGIFWFILSLLLDNINDVIMKYVGNNISSYEIIFFRYLFSVIVLLPFILRKKYSSSTIMRIHFIRGFLLFVGIILWCVGLKVVKLTVATSINFIMPIFILILARIFLKESFNRIKLIATMLGFIGTIIVINPNSTDFNLTSLVFLISAILFALLDIINKRFAVQESMISMLFYSSLFVLILSIIHVFYNWITPTFNDLFYLFLLGITSNLILYCLLKSFKLIEVSSVAPYRYIELIFSAVLGYIIFDEIPDLTTIIGSAIIIMATVILVYETIIIKKFSKIEKVKLI
ncbi:DMT family transporter [Rickettsiales endosymbiont of Trichoplax sp. H2]|uniref:DMT family transporter n=1 Tax=Rickettsiales endosymbiont of Trichoplax sp. H2 TaxID=2021221 RepID=UPI0012B2EA9D|nr:DMT family transporter [Rickettsiales endosymbiont of Trichoplax sp. H2]MSO13306.1 S-adenosylmethionine uptake transporter [Rickettsiales endosymbiont of Trichoplax sp. H2]